MFGGRATVRVTGWRLGAHQQLMMKPLACHRSRTGGGGGARGSQPVTSHTLRYCGAGCQRAAYPTHKRVCQSQDEQAAVDPVEELLRQHAPADFCCPISKVGRALPLITPPPHPPEHPPPSLRSHTVTRDQDIMVDPVTLVGDGMTYGEKSVGRERQAFALDSPRHLPSERASIARWLESNSTSPVTNAGLSSTALAPSQIVRNMIRAWREKEGAELVRAWREEEGGGGAGGGARDRGQGRALQAGLEARRGHERSQ